MPEIPLKISRAIICKKARELRHNNFMGQGESVLCNLRSAFLCLRGSRTPRRRNLDVKDRGSRNREGSSRTSLDSTAKDALLIVFMLCYFIFLFFFKQLKETFEFKRLTVFFLLK